MTDFFVFLHLQVLSVRAFAIACLPGLFRQKLSQQKPLLHGSRPRRPIYIKRKAHSLKAATAFKNQNLRSLGSLLLVLSVSDLDHRSIVFKITIFSDRDRCCRFENT